jgi:hypothetical protein
MRIVHFEKAGVPGIAADDGSGKLVSRLEFVSGVVAMRYEPGR